MANTIRSIANTQTVGLAASRFGKRVSLRSNSAFRMRAIWQLQSA
ncbi:MAG: hypothetical protein ABWY82_12190 [Tardiphaga sp.]